MAGNFHSGTAVLQLLLSLVLFATTGGRDMQKISVDKNGWFVDGYGRVRFFHGLSEVWKQPPWVSEDMLNQTRIQFYADLGFNAVRLGMMWTGVQPQKNVFNETYLSVNEQVVKSLNDRGMYAFLDMHQDVMAEQYDGIPRWLVDMFPPAPHPYPWPFKTLGNWGEGYITEEVSMQFQDFYKNVSGSVDYFAAFWQKVAQTFKDHSNILAYELINEPWAGDVFHKPELFLPGEAGKQNLLPVYNLINNAIRKIDDQTIIFYEPVTWGVIFNGKDFGSGFNSVPGGDLYRNRSALSYHYYCWIITTPDLPKPYPAWKRDVCDEVWGPNIFDSVRKDLKDIGGGSFLTEFGICGADGKNSTETVECEFVMRKADENLQSWTYWDGGFFDAQGNINWNKAKSFGRAYAQTVAGVPLKMSFNITTAEFVLQYVHDEAINAPTEIFVPKLHYPHGFTVQLTDKLKWSFDATRNIIQVTTAKSRGETSNQIPQLINASFTMKPKTQKCLLEELIDSILNN